MLSFLIEQIWIGIDYFLLNFIATFGSVLGLQVTAGPQVKPWPNQRNSRTDDPEHDSNCDYTFDQVHSSIAATNSTLYVA